jgi:hypothetical protein
MTDLALSANFNMNELKSALKCFNLGTGAGFDGVYPEVIQYFGEITKE